MVLYSKENLESQRHSRDNGPESQTWAEVVCGKQLGFSEYELTTANKQTKREKFHFEIDVMLPWQSLFELHYLKTSKKDCRPPYPLATMLRIYFLQQWYSLRHLAMEVALIEVPAMRRFAGIELISNLILDETTIMTIRPLLEKHELDDQISPSARKVDALYSEQFVHQGF